MSLILEALRKSEAERQRDGTPNVAMELPPVLARGNGATPGWVWPTLLVVVIGAVLVAWLGMRAGQRDHDVNTAPSTAVAAAAPPAAPVVTAAPAPSPAPRMTAAPAPSPVVAAPQSPAHDAVRVTEDRPPPAPPASLPAPARPMPPATAAAPAPVRPAPAPAIADNDQDAPPIAATGLPAVKLSMHMWDADPAKRFVIIDGQRMGEGDRSGGLAVIAIRRDGVIVERNGLRAKVPLP